MFESAPGLYLVLAPDLTIVAASDDYLRFAGTGREKIVGRKIPSIFPDNPENPAARDVLNLAASLQEVLSSGAPDTMALQRHDIRRPEPEGGGLEERCRRLVNTPVFAPDGTLAFIIHRVEDVTETVHLQEAACKREKLAEELRGRAERLESLEGLYEKTRELDHLKTDFFANVSQEFRTALKLILALVEYARAQGDGTLEGQDLRAVQFNSLRLLKLANSLVDLARIEGGRIELALEPTNLSGLTEQLVESFRPMIEKGGLELILDCPPLPDAVYVDRAIWEQIVVNLVSNALKFTFEGSIAVSMECHSGNAVVLFRDTGTGIPANELPRIFERYHRIPGARSRTYEGAGIGLALVHELVRQHGGTIDAWSEVGRGTTFRVSLPMGWRSIADSEAAHHDTPVSTEVIASMERLKARKHVLIVDDNPNTRGYLSGLLSPHFRVTVAEDGSAALAAVRMDRPDLIVSDVIMPVIDGFTLVRNLRKNSETAAIPIILHSAGGGEDDCVTGIEAGADDYIAKSVTPQELLARVKTQLELSQVQRATADAARELAESRTALLKEPEVWAREHNTEHKLSRYPATPEVREPQPYIAGLIEMIETLFEVSLDASDKRYLSRLGAADMDTLIDNLLTFSRLSRTEMRNVPINLGVITEEVIEQLHGREAGATAQWTLGELPCIPGDAAMMRLALFHLISNALKFSSPRPNRKINVGAELDGNNILLHVRDNGVGFNMDHAGRLFGIFQKLHSHEEFEGAGIGLAIVRRIIEKHGGRTWATGVGGEGATFYCSLPRGKKPEKESNP